MSDPQFDETIPLPQPGISTSVPDSMRSASTSSMDLVGKQLDDFRVLRRLGAGAMAEVFLAEQVSLLRQVALKILKPELVGESDDTHLKRFKQEATAAANLSHPNIVQVFAVGEHEGVHYIAQEYVPGLTLREWLRKSGPPEPLIAIKLLRQVALALQAASEAGIVHRDIKPENVLLTKKGDAKVADFGLAQLAQGSDRVQLTQVGMTMGTPLYMSPEQVAGKPLDHRSDLYSLGVTAYHLLAGSPPFRGETALSVAVQHLNVPPEPLRTVRPDLPRGLCEVVEKLMQKRPEDRYQSAADLAEDLRAMGVALKSDPHAAAKTPLGSFTVAKAAAAPARPYSIRRFFEWSGQQHAITLAATAVAVLLMATGVGWATRPADPFLEPAPTMPRKGVADSARAQWNLAQFAGTEDAYEAVIENFPEDKDRFWVSAAQMRLGLLRLYKRDFAGAEEMFREMQLSSDQTTQINGATGYAVVAAARGDTEEFNRRVGLIANLLAKYGKDSDRDRNESIHYELRRLLEGFRERLGLDARTQIDSLIGEPEDVPNEPADES